MCPNVTNNVLLIVYVCPIVSKCVAETMSKARKTVKTEGELFQDLYFWTQIKSVKEFADKIDGKSRSWAQRLFTLEIIPKREKVSICKTFNIPIEYFSGEFELPLRPDNVSEPHVKYGTSEDLMNEINNLRKNLIERDKEVIALQKKIIDLMEKVHS